jgi:hypothetical protein
LELPNAVQCEITDTDSVVTKGNILDQVTFAHLQSSPHLLRFVALALLRLTGVSCQPYS